MATANTNQYPVFDRTEEEELPTEARDKAPTPAAKFGQVAKIGACPMNERESFSDLIYDEQTHLAELELSSFVCAVTKLYGPRQARLSAQDWLDESELVNKPPLSPARNWRAVTIAASARLADRLNITGNR
jgi:hypothetical protein